MLDDPKNNLEGFTLPNQSITLIPYLLITLYYSSKENQITYKEK